MADLPKLPGIPSITSVKDTTVAAILRPMKESLEILGGAISGNPLPNGNVITGGFNTAISNNITITDGYDGTKDYTPPPGPTGFSISSGFTNILLSWDDPNTSGTFLNYAYTEIWRSVDNVLGHAVLQGSTVAAVYTDPVGTSKTYYYWIRFVSQADVSGPYNASTGTIGGTGLVGGVDLGPLIITADKIASGAIDLGGAKITGLLANANMAVISDATKIADSLIGNTKLQNLAVDASKLADSSVTTTKIANLAVGTAAIQTGAITNALIANAAVGSAQIGDAAITSAKIANLAVGSAAIQNAAIVNAKIDDLAVDNAKIANLSVGKLTAGAVSVGQYIQSTGYSAGTNGWYIGGNGFAEFGATAIRGQLVASQIDTRNLTIKDNAGNVLLGSGTNLNFANITPSTGWLNSNITMSSNGTLSGAGGGSVTATGLGAVKTDLTNAPAGILNSNVSLGTLGAGAFAYLNSITSGNVSTYISGAAIGTAQIGVLTANNIGAGTIDAGKIAVSTLSAISANLGTITAGTIRLPATGNSYLIIDGNNNRIDVYENGVLRVRLGNLV